MARKETIYTVNAKTNEIMRASRSYLAALEFGDTLDAGSFYTCTSEFPNLKKGDPMSNVTAYL